MQRLLVFVFLLIVLTGCIHKMPIEQGNILTPDMVKQLHTGMNFDEVKKIMGTPVLMNTFSNNRVDYVYTLKPAKGQFVEKYVTLIFQNDRLAKISGNMYSQVIQ